MVLVGPRHSGRVALCSLLMCTRYPGIIIILLYSCYDIIVALHSASQVAADC